MPPSCCNSDTGICRNLASRRQRHRASGSNFRSVGERFSSTSRGAGLYGATSCIALLQQQSNSKPLVLHLCAAGIISMCRDRNSHPLFCRHRDKAMRRSQALLTEGTSSCTRLLTCGQTTSLMFQEHAVLDPSACTMLQCYFHLATCMHDPRILKFSYRLQQSIHCLMWLLFYT